MRTWILFLYTIHDPSGADVMQTWLTPTESLEQCRERLPSVRQLVRGNVRDLAEKYHAGIHFENPDGMCVEEGSEGWNYAVNEIPKKMSCKTTDWPGDEPMLEGSKAISCVK